MFFYEYPLCYSSVMVLGRQNVSKVQFALIFRRKKLDCSCNASALDGQPLGQGATSVTIWMHALFIVGLQSFG